MMLVIKDEGVGCTGNLVFLNGFGFDEGIMMLAIKDEGVGRTSDLVFFRSFGS